MGFSKRRFDKEYESKLEMFKFAVEAQLRNFTYNC